MEDLTGLGKALETVATLPKELRDFFHSLIGPAGEQAGELLADKLRYLRFKHAIQTFEQAMRLLKEKNLQPRAVNFRLLFPILEGSSLEEDTDIRSKWAALLAPVAAGDEVHPSFPKILAELASTDARLLDMIYDKAGTDGEIKVEELLESEQGRVEQVSIAVNNLFRLQLCESTVFRGHADPSLFRHDYLRVTPFGRCFVEACRGPQ